MRNAIHLTPELVDDLQAVIDYNWDDEESDYEREPDPSHLFLRMQRLQVAINNQLSNEE